MKHLLLFTALFFTCFSIHAQTLVKDIYEGQGHGRPNNFVTLGNYTYFVASDSTHGFELWKTDGRGTGTTMVKNINPNGDGLAEDQDGLVFSDLTLMDNELYFYANDDSTGYELWKSDGTETGTVQVKDIFEGSESSAYLGAPVAVMGNYLYFSAQDTTGNRQLWKSNGTTAGTTPVTEIQLDCNPRDLFAHNNLMYFVADSGFSGGTLWITDGTANGTEMLKDVDSVNYSWDVSNYTVYNNKVYFSSYETVHGQELWVSDGTPAGTQLAVDIVPGTNGSNPQYTVLLGGKMIFAAFTIDRGNELWLSDGTPGGTMEIKDIDTASGMSSNPEELTLFDDKVFFKASGGMDNAELWSSDGTANGTQLVKEINTTTTTFTSSYPLDLTVINGMLYFNADDSLHGRELYQSDGTPGGTVMLSDLRGGDYGSYPSGFTRLNNMVIFGAENDVYGKELYRLGEPTAINEVSAAAGFSIQPNPAKGHVLIVASEKAIGSTLRLLDITGKQISSTTLSTAFYQLNTTALPAGVYLVNLLSLNGGMAVKKLLIE